MEALWRRPAASDDAPVAEAASTQGGRESRHLSRIKVNALLTAALVLLWSLRVAAAMPAFWLLAVLIRLAARRPLDPPRRRAPSAAARHRRNRRDADPGHGLSRARPARGADHRRAGAARLGRGIDLERLAGRETTGDPGSRTVSSSAIAIALIADFIWHVARPAIDCSSPKASISAGRTPRATAKGTAAYLLPIFRTSRSSS